MAAQKRGHEAHRSRFQQTKTRLEFLLLRQKVLTESIHADSLELAALPQQIAAAQAAHTSELVKVRAELGDEKRKEFLQIAAALDTAETAEALARFKYLAADLHSNFGGLVRPAHEARTMVLRRLAGLVPGAPPLRARTYLATAQSWLKSETTEQAA